MVFPKDFCTFFNSVLRPFQDYFSSYETGQSEGGRKRENPEKKHLAHPQAELGLSHVARAGLEPNLTLCVFSGFSVCNKEKNEPRHEKTGSSAFGFATRIVKILFFPTSKNSKLLAISCSCIGRFVLHLVGNRKTDFLASRLK